MIVGVDIGFGHVKAVSSTGGQFICPSVVGPGRDILDLIKFSQVNDDRTEHMRAIYNREEYFIGDLAIDQCGGLNYFSMKDEKAESVGTKILMLAALAYLAGKGAHSVDVVTGLPIDFYFQQRHAFEAMLNDISGERITLKLGNDEYTSQILIRNHRTFAQGQGVLANEVLDDGGNLVNRLLARKRILVVDIGMHTINLVTIDGMKPPLQPYSKSPKLGMATIHKEISKQLNGKPLYEVDREIRQGKIDPREHYRKLGEVITAEIESMNTDHDVYLVAGGGGEVLYPWIMPRSDVKVLAAQAQFANAKGYLKLGMKLWQSANIG